MYVCYNVGLMRIHERIKYERKRKKLTLIQLSKLASISYGMLYRLEEGGILEPSPDLLKSVVDPLGLDYQKILREYGYFSSVEGNKKHIEKVPLLKCDVFNFDKGFTAKQDSFRCFELISCGSSSEYFLCKRDFYSPFLKQNDIFGVEVVDDLCPQQLYFCTGPEGTTHLMIAKMYKRFSPRLSCVRSLCAQLKPMDNFVDVKRLFFISG